MYKEMLCMICRNIVILGNLSSVNWCKSWDSGPDLQIYSLMLFNWAPQIDFVSKLLWKLLW